MKGKKGERARKREKGEERKTEKDFQHLGRGEEGRNEEDKGVRKGAKKGKEECKGEKVKQ